MIEVKWFVFIAESLNEIFGVRSLKMATMPKHVGIK